MQMDPDNVSSHRIQTKKFIIAVGVDRPLQHVFATVLNRSGRPARGFPAFASYPLNRDGVKQATDALEAFVRKSEGDWSLPQIVIQGLHDDLEIMNEGGDIGNVHIYECEQS
jgi:hypothetical protein